MRSISGCLKKWYGRTIILLMMISVSGCAARPYRITNFFSSPVINELREVRVAVIPFKNLSPISQASELVTDEFNLQLGRLGKFRLVERMRIQEIFREQDLDPERIDDATAVKIGKMLGAHIIVLGTVTSYYPYKYKEKKEQEERERKELERMKIEAEKAPSTVIVVDQSEKHYHQPAPAPGHWEKQQKESPQEENDKDKNKDKNESGDESTPGKKAEENNVWIAAAVVGGIILTGGILYFALKPKPSAEAGISVRMVNIETGEQLWQAKDAFKGDDNRVKVLVEDQDREKVEKDVEYLSRILCREIAKTIGK